MRRLLLLFVAASLSGCIIMVDHDDAADCFGSLSVARPIPDLSLTLGEAYERDLDDDRAPVFDAPRGVRVRYEVDDGQSAAISVRLKWGNVLHVEAERPGSAYVRIRARSEGCQDAYTTFSVAVSSRAAAP